MVAFQEGFCLKKKIENDMKDCHSADTDILRPTEVKVCLGSHTRLVTESGLLCPCSFSPTAVYNDDSRRAHRFKKAPCERWELGLT